MTTLYSHTLRILTCANCGALLEAQPEGGSFTCGYCGAVSQLQRRDEAADRTAAAEARSSAPSESERYARLRQQDAQGAPLPGGLAAWVVNGALPSERVEAADELWRQTRAEMAITPSFPVCERFFHLTVLLAPHLDERRRRAALETAVELLPDAGHRHVLRCKLAREAARVGDVDAAEAWLEAVNPRPTDLEQDTAYRLATATIAAARGEPQRVVEALGFRPADVPLFDRDELACTLLRLDALERLGREADATSEMSLLVERLGLPVVQHAVLSHRPLTLCGRSFEAARQRAEGHRAAAHREHLEALRRGVVSQLQRVEPRASQRLTAVVLGTGALAFLLGTVWTCLLTGLVQTGPLFGAHAALVCPLVCNDCTGPYRIVSWRSNVNGAENSHLDVFCSDRAGRVSALSEGGLRLAAATDAAELERYEVPAGIWGIGLSMQIVFTPLALALMLLLQLRRALRDRPRARELRGRLAELDRQLASGVR